MFIIKTQGDALGWHMSALRASGQDNMITNHPIDAAMENAIKDGIFPGASLLVGKGDDILWSQIYGNAQTEPINRPVQSDTFFDIASLTKPMATSTLFMLALQEKKYSLDDSLQKYFPQALQKGITVENLLNHSSGLPAWKPYYEELLSFAPGWATEEKGETWVIDQILAEPQEHPAHQKVIYSDLGYILLGRILEKIYGDSLDSLFQHKIANPLKLKQTFFNPLGHHREAIDNNPEHFAATEKCPWRQKILCGEVMDDHAYVMGGVAGHAGLFSTAKDIAIWIRCLNAARSEKSPLISKATFDTFCTVPKKRNLQEPFFTLGFDTPTLASSSGQYFSPNSLGHLGYSGTSFWWDLDKNVTVILLTNRVHPSRENQKIKEFRPRIHDVILESLALI